MNFGDIKSAHFVGIGGIGMSGIAEVLAGGGIAVTGCDLRRSAITDHLQSRGIAVQIGHDPSHLSGHDLVVITSAVRGVHAEVDAARASGMRVMKRAEVLGALVAEKRSVCVAGTHGKTTTSAMMTMILEEAGLQPTVLVGGVIRNLETNARRGAGDFIVAEADEYDRTFHQLRPEIAIITNIEADHLEYYGSLEAIVEAFSIFVRGVAEHGSVIGCADDPLVLKLLEETRRQRPGLNVIGYGLGEKADLRATELEFSERGAHFDIQGIGSFELFVPGEHNVRNALSTIAAARQLGIDAATISSALARFLGVDRRFQLLGEYRGALIVDDYAHHPTEIRATLDAARRGYPNRRLVALFQPHLFSRTRDFAGDFAEALRGADVPLVAPIYAAREQPEDGVTAGLIASEAGGIEYLDRDHAGIVEELRRRLEPNDLLITMGAGDVHEIAEELARGGIA
jgi:UDP-N-acetylmuramate--alanine ligase